MDSEDINAGLCKLLGYYLAEGSASGKNGKLHHLDFSLHRTEEAIAEEIYQECFRIYGKARHYLSPHINRQTARAVVVDSSAAAQHMVDLGGKGAANKQMSNAVMHLPPEKQLQILLGWLAGDGHTTKHRRFKQGIVCSGTTISHKLVYQMQQIALRCGLFASINSLKPGGRRKNTSYTLLFTGDAARRLVLCHTSNLG